MKKKTQPCFLSRLRESALVSMLLLGVTIGIVLVVNMNPSEIITSYGSRGWRSIATADGTIPAGGSGYCYFMVYPHQAAPATAYKSNLSNASAYEFSDVLNAEMTRETPYNTAFDFVLKFRVNATVGYNTSGTKWMDSWVRANLSVNFEYASDISNAAMTIIQIANNTDYAWYHGYMNNAAAGYQITKNEKFNCTMVKAEGYW